MNMNTEVHKKMSPLKKATAWVGVIAVVLGGLITLTGYFGKGFFSSFATKEDISDLKVQFQRLSDSERMETAQWSNIKTNADNDIDIKVRIGVVEKMLDMVLDKGAGHEIPTRPLNYDLYGMKEELKKDRYSKKPREGELKDFIQQQHTIPKEPFDMEKKK